MSEDFKVAEQYFEFQREKRSESDIRKREKEQRVYEKYFSEFKKIKKELKEYMLSDQNNGKHEEFLKKVEAVSEKNPFVKHLLAEMYCRGQMVELNEVRAQQYFAEVLDIFRHDLESGIITSLEYGDNEIFDFQSYIDYRIGKMYDRGWGTAEDKSVAAEYYTHSDTQYARYALGCLYYSGHGVDQDYESAFSLFQSIQGNAFADLKCAEIYEQGKGTEMDLAAGRKYYESAFKEFMQLEDKEADALYEYQLGRLMYVGKGCEQDTEQAVNYLQKAAKQKKCACSLTSR